MELDYKSLLLNEWTGQKDPAHDISHVQRVVRLCEIIGAEENARLDILTPAAWFHDLVNLPKDHPDRTLASKLSADRANELLKARGKADPDTLAAIHHAIVAHSFSANITPETLEAKILQDADRLDALGVIGMLRTFAVSGRLGGALFDPEDPFAENRPLDDSKYALDHFEMKLFKLPGQMHMQTARYIAVERESFMRAFMEKLQQEL